MSMANERRFCVFYVIHVAVYTSLILPLVDSTLCFDCPAVAHPDDCHHTKSCYPNQECYVRRHLAHNLTDYFSLGCMDATSCAHSQFPYGSLIGKRGRTADIGWNPIKRDYSQSLLHVKRDTNIGVTCVECCSQPGCNKGPCKSFSQASMKCLSCQHVDDPKHCDGVEECSSSNEMCAVYMSPTLSGYSLKCMPKLTCEAFERLSATSTLCNKCCNNSNYCNFDVCDGWTHNTHAPSTTPTTTLPTTTTPKPAPIPVINGHNSAVYYASLQLTCHVTGTVDRLIWTFNGHQGLPAGVTYQGNGEISILSIAHLTESNMGTYSCMALAYNGQTAQSSLTVHIQPTPATVVSVIRDPHGTLHSGDIFSISCMVIGYPKPAIKWGFLPTDGSIGIPIDVEFSADNLRMMVTQSGYSAAYHDGTWTCTARNDFGHSEQHVIIP